MNMGASQDMNNGGGANQQQVISHSITYLPFL